MKLTTRAVINAKVAYKLAWNRAKKYNAIPKYCRLKKNRLKILAVYIKAQVMNLSGKGKWEVDHILPLYHSEVCGLHTHFNLQVLSKDKNQLKSNKFAPYIEKNGRKTYLKALSWSEKSPKIPRKYNPTKKSPQKLAKKRLKTVKTSQKCVKKGQKCLKISTNRFSNFPKK